MDRKLLAVVVLAALLITLRVWDRERISKEKSPANHIHTTGKTK